MRHEVRRAIHEGDGQLEARRHLGHLHRAGDAGRTGPNLHDVHRLVEDKGVEVRGVVQVLAGGDGGEGACRWNTQGVHGFAHDVFAQDGADGGFAVPQEGSALKPLVILYAHDLEAMEAKVTAAGGVITVPLMSS